MNDLPTKNMMSLKRGYWFVFQDEGNTIVAGGFDLSKKERIFFNGELVSEKETIGESSEHEFTVGENSYKIIFDITDLMKGKVMATLMKNNVVVKKYQSNPTYKISSARIAVYLVLSLMFIAGIIQYDIWPYTIPVIVLFACLLWFDHTLQRVRSIQFEAVV